MKELIAHCEIKGGVFKWKNPEYVMQLLSKFEGCAGTLTIKKKWNRRSISQNALLWTWFQLIGDYIGENKNEVYRIMTGLYSPKVEVKMGTKIYNIPKGTSKMTKGEMVSFLLDVQSEAAQLGIALPTREDAPMFNE